jgi:hypothetical protein
MKLALPVRSNLTTRAGDDKPNLFNVMKDKFLTIRIPMLFTSSHSPSPSSSRVFLLLRNFIKGRFLTIRIHMLTTSNHSIHSKLAALKWALLMPSFLK